ncbi:MAG: DUF6382 domain-containing protein [Eubacteriales bacterium]|nr:DUF6382 domain-containing protein [Eubacteriales bacterium]
MKMTETQDGVGLLRQGQMYFEVQGEERCVVYAPPVDSVIDEGLVELLQEERIENVLPLIRVQRGSRPLLCYLLTEGESLEKVLKRRITLVQLRLIVGSVARLWMDMEQYLAEPRRLVLAERFLFLTEDRLRAVYLPLLAATDIDENEDALREWLLELLPKIRLSDEAAVPLLADLLQLAHGQEPLTAGRLCEAVGEANAGRGEKRKGERAKEAFREKAEEKSEELRRRCQEYFTPQAKPERLNRFHHLKQRVLALLGKWWGAVRLKKNVKDAPQAHPQTEMRIEPRIEPGIGSKTKPKQPSKQPSLWNRLESGDSRETELLQYTELIGGGMARLIRERSHECILLEDFPFRLGKGSRAVNHQIAGNEAISRCHLEIRQVGGAYEAVDLASTNGSYVNGSRLTAHQPQPLHPGDVLRLADEDFVFRQ